MASGTTTREPIFGLTGLGRRHLMGAKMSVWGGLDHARVFHGEEVDTEHGIRNLVIGIEAVFAR